MSLPVRLSAGAQHDVEDTVAWYEGQRVGLGGRFVAALDRLIDRVSENPQQFPVIVARWCAGFRMPYTLLYPPTTLRSSPSCMCDDTRKSGSVDGRKAENFLILDELSGAIVR